LFIKGHLFLFLKEKPWVTIGSISTRCRAHGRVMRQINNCRGDTLRAEQDPASAHHGSTVRKVNVSACVLDLRRAANAGRL